MSRCRILKISVIFCLDYCCFILFCAPCYFAPFEISLSFKGKLPPVTPWWRMSRQKKQAFSGDDNERVWSEKRNTFHWRNPTWVHHVIKPTLIRLRDFGRIQSGSNLEKGVWTWKNYREKLRAPPFRYMIVQREVFFVRYQTAEGQSKSRRSKIQTTLEWNSKHNDSKFCESKPKLSSQLLREFFAFNHHRC